MQDQIKDRTEIKIADITDQWFESIPEEYRSLIQCQLEVGELPWTTEYRECWNEFFAAPNDNAHELVGLFTFDFTPQGHSYWFDRYMGRVQLSEDDIKWLRAFYEFTSLVKR